MSGAIHTHYKNLSIFENATQAEIDAAYEALMAKYSAPEHAEDPEAARIRGVLTISHERLSSPESRRLHDRWVALARFNLHMDTSTTPFSSAPVPAWRNTESDAASTTARTATAENSSSIGLGLLLVSPLLLALLMGWITKRTEDTPTRTDSPAKSVAWVAPVHSAAATPPTSSTANVPIATVPAATTSPPSPAVTTPLTQSLNFQPDLASAAVTANVRSAPSAKSNVVRTIERATPLQQMGVEGTFVQVRLADGVLGWVAQELLIPQTDARRLSSLTATAYMSERSPEKRLAALDTTIMSGDAKRRIDATFSSFSSPTLNVAATVSQLHELAQLRIIAPAADDSAAVWYTLAATAARNSGNLNDALTNYRAAAEAAPATGAHHSAVALAAYEAGNHELLQWHAYTAMAMSPESTNSCLVFALALASLSSAEQPREIAMTNTLRVALHYSRDAAFTARYLRGLATKATNPMVARAIDRALSN